MPESKLISARFFSPGTFSRFVCGLFCLVLLPCDNVLAQQQSSSRKSKQPSEASLFETQGDIKAFSKRLKEASDDVQRTDAMVDLCYLYLRVVGDSRFSRSRVLQGNRGRIAAKLQSARNDIQKLKRKSETEAKKRASQSARSRRSSKRDTDLASSSDSASASVSGQSTRTFESAVIDKQWLMLAHAVGGTAPSMYYGSGMQGTSGHFYRGRAGGLPGDNGDQLLDLVRTIIHPDFWQINGGPGRAYYYQPLRILVVRATQRVHEDLQSLLERLRGQL